LIYIFIQDLIRRVWGEELESDACSLGKNPKSLTAVDGAVIKNQNALGARIGIHERNLR